MSSSIYFLSLADPSVGLGVWLRFTRRGPAAELWAMITLPGTPPVIVAHRAPVPIIEWSETALRISATGARISTSGAPGVGVSDSDPGAASSASGRLAIGEGVLTEGGTRGTLGDGASRVTWALSWPAVPVPVAFFPYRWMYRAPWPTTKYTVPGPALRCRGTIQVGERRFAITEAPGHLGHTWGPALAVAWAWAQSSAFVEGEGAFEALSARVRLGPILSPPLTLARVRIEREIYRFDRWTRWCRNRTRWNRDGWTLETVAGAMRLHAELRVDPNTVVGVTYVDLLQGLTSPPPVAKPLEPPPHRRCAAGCQSGDRRYCYNSVLGDATIELAERHGAGWTTRHRLTCRRTMTYEHVGRVPDPVLPLHL